MITEELIKEKLSKKEARELLVLIRKTLDPSINVLLVHHGIIEKFLQKNWPVKYDRGTRLAFTKDFKRTIDADIFTKWMVSHENLLTIDNNVLNYFYELEDQIESFGGSFSTERLENILRCWNLYCKVTDDYKDILIHWRQSYKEQKELHESYSKMARPSRQDNKTYLNTSPSWGSSNRNKIRYPKKNRKTAWKRFYKLFPHLDPKNNEE